jgi:Domain of unknown function (DUF4912)
MRTPLPATPVPGTIARMVAGAVQWGGSMLRSVTSCLGGCASLWYDRLARQVGETVGWQLRGQSHPPEGPDAPSAYRPIRPRPTAAAPTAPSSAPAEAPATGNGELVVLARDPWSLFAYWDLPASVRVARLRTLGPAARDAEEALRLTPLPAGDPIVLVLPAGTARRFVRVEPPGRSWLVEFGLRTQDGTFIPWLRADPISTPAERPSDDTTVYWMAVTPNAPPIPAERRWNGARLPRAAETPAPCLPSSHARPAT